MDTAEPDGQDGQSSTAGDRTPTSSSTQSEQPTQQAQAAVIPVYLQRLTIDYARQLRRAQGENEPEPPTAVADGTRAAPSPQPASTPFGSSPKSTTTDFHATRSLTQGLNGVSAGTGLPPLTLPQAALELATAASTAAAATQTAVTAGTAVVTTTATAIVNPTPTTSITTYTPNRRLEDVYSPPKQIAPAEDLLPPDNFAMVSSFIYRSSFPKKKNFPFLRSLGLKSVL